MTSCFRINAFGLQDNRHQPLEVMRQATWRLVLVQAKVIAVGVASKTHSCHASAIHIAENNFGQV
jgi:hypothetical protein